MPAISDFEPYMRVALKLAAEAAADDEIPVGCVIADAEGNIIGCGRNRRESSRLVSGHAEVDALDNACRARGDWRLSDCTMFVTLEPCCMCAGAAVNARIGTVVYGAEESLTGACSGAFNLFEENRTCHPAVYSGVLAEESEALLRSFFEKHREKQQSFLKNSGKKNEKISDFRVSI